MTPKWTVGRKFTNDLYRDLGTTTLDGQPTIAYPLHDLMMLLQDLILRHYGFTKASKDALRILGNIALFLVEYHHRFKISKSLFPKKLSSIFSDAQQAEKERRQNFNGHVRGSPVVERIRGCIVKGLGERGIRYDDRFFYSALEDFDQILTFLKNSGLKGTDLDSWHLFNNLFMGCPEFTQSDPALLLFLYWQALPLLVEKMRVQKFRQKKTTLNKMKQFLFK